MYSLHSRFENAERLKLCLSDAALGGRGFLYRLRSLRKPQNLKKATQNFVALENSKEDPESEEARTHHAPVSRETELLDELPEFSRLETSDNFHGKPKNSVLEQEVFSEETSQGGELFILFD